MIHPFREGNGRTQRIFIAQLIRYNGYDINFSEIDADELMISTILSAQGVTDNLMSIFRNNIKSISN
jgi:cell filamentation protein